jgi:hypothetical protein
MTRTEAITRETTGWSHHIGGSGDAPEFFVRLDPAPARLIAIPGHSLEGNLARIRLIAAAPTMRDALIAVRAFVESEVENRGAAGSDMTDHQGEAEQALATIDAALSKAGAEQ